MSTRIINFFESSGLSWLAPFAKLVTGDNPSEQVRIILKSLGVPLAAFVLFLFFWDLSASKVDTSLGKLPGPSQVIEQAQGLMAEHQAEKEKEIAFYERQEKRNAAKLEKNPDAN